MQIATIDGVTLRAWHHDDLAGMCTLIGARVIAEGEGEPVTLESITAQYEHLEHCDPATDIVVAVDDDDRVVGYARTCWFDMADGYRSYHVIYETAGQPGCEEQLLDWSLQRGAEVAATHDHPDRRFDAMAADGTARAAAIGDRGFVPYRVERADGASPPERSSRGAAARRARGPSGGRGAVTHDLGSRRRGVPRPPVRAEKQSENDWEIFRADVGDTSLWHVAWDQAGVAGQVRTYVIEGESVRLGRKRAWTESISTRRDWHGRGVASAVIVASLRQLAALGYDEAALGVDLDNPTGALGVYERLGYRVVKRYTAYSRPIEAVPSP